MKTQSFNSKKILTIAVAGGALVQTVTPALAAIAVQLNGQPLNTSVPPVKIRNRTVVPMRDIFEALGASVQWNAATQAITAQKDATTINLGINNRRAYINGRQVLLDQPATLWRGRTMVPLRFVSEAMGAQVGWNDALQLVSIDSPIGVVENPGLPPVQGNPVNPLPAPGTQVGNTRYISVPAGVVVPVSLDQTLSSAITRVGDAFTASVISQRIGDSEFPAGTKIEGRVIESRPRQGDNPGVLDLEFRSALLPTGERIPLRGDLISLDNDSVVSNGGRIVAQSRSGQSSGDKLKIVGIGAAAGYVLGRVLDTNSTITTVLGAAGGYLYSRSRDKNKAADAVLAQNTRLGVRLSDALTYADVNNYAADRENFLRVSFNESVLGVPTARSINQPSQPVYQPQPAPQQPVYQPNQPVYQPAPQQPVYQPNQPVYQPNQPVYPNQPAPGVDTVLPQPAQPTYPPVIDLNQPQNPAYPAYQNNPQPVRGRNIRIPSNVVVPVTLDETLSSANTRVGQTFSATVVSERIGDSEFPAGTKIEGVVIESRPRQGNNPGVLDLDFRTAVLPNGQVIPLNATLITLDNDAVNTEGGRIVAKSNKKSTGDRLKIVGIGAGLGFVLGKVLDKNTTLTTILGAAGGYLYSRSKDKSASEAVVKAGTKLGVRLAAPVSYADYNNYSDYRSQFLRG